MGSRQNRALVLFLVSVLIKPKNQFRVGITLKCSNLRDEAFSMIFAIWLDFIPIFVLCFLNIEACQARGHHKPNLFQFLCHNKSAKEYISLTNELATAFPTQTLSMSHHDQVITMLDFRA